MVKEEHFRKLEGVYAAAPINHLFGASLRVHEGRAEVVIPVQEKLYHAADAVHGSAYFKALDDAAFFAANSLVEDVFVLTVSFNLYLTRPISTGLMVARGEVVHQSRRLFVADSVLEDSQGRQIARGSGIFMRSSIELSPDIGYR